MTLKNKIKIGISNILIAILAYAVNFAIKYAYIGSAFNAKMVFSCTFVSNRDLESIKTEDLYAVPFSTLSIDKKEHSVTANIYGPADNKNC